MAADTSFIMINECKYALRVFAKSPGFTAIAVLTLVLGIGANSAIFSVVDAVLLRPLPYPNPDQLITVWAKVPHENSDRETEAFPNYVDLRDQSQTLQSLTAFTRAGGVLTGADESREIRGLAVTSDIFQVLKVPPMLGRSFTREEDNADARVILFTYHAWKTLFNGDPNIVGKQISISWRNYTVLGIMPQGFQFPIEGERTDYLMPLHPLVPEGINRRDSHFLRLVGRMKPGITLQQCNAELSAIAGRLAQQYPDSNTDRTEQVFKLHDDVVGGVRAALITILAAVVFVLLIACANVANLLLARATARRREIAIRTALGASRARIVVQLLSEGFLLAVLGAVGGLLLAWWATDFFRAFGPPDLPRIREIAVNTPVILFTILVTVGSTMLFALVPALQVTRPNVNESLQEGSRGGTGPESHRLRGLLVIAQVALSLLLLTGAGLLIKSFANLRATKPGFESSRAVTVQLVLPKVKYPNPEQHRQFFDQIVPKLAAVPGIEAAGGAMPMPFSGNDSGSTFSVVGQPPVAPGNRPVASHLTITPDYFRAMRIPVLGGRAFDDHDTKESAQVVMVNETFARRFLGKTNPIGQRIAVDRSEADRSDSQAPPLEIVGVVGSTRHESLAIEPEPEFYIPAAQDPARRMDIVLRTTGSELAGLQTSIANIVHQFDKDIFVPKLDTLENRVGVTLAQPKFNTMLLGIFAGVAMVLAAIGIYGVIAYSVAQRTREIGIRMALGAQRTDMLRMILRQSLRLVIVGLGVGVATALGATRLMGALLYGVRASDLSTYVTVILLLGGAAFLASLIPARRAMKVDPMVALRYE
jgi:putative ABC transport system permease protein